MSLRILPNTFKENDNNEANTFLKKLCAIASSMLKNKKKLLFFVN
jgi:hypothetical protein